MVATSANMDDFMMLFSLWIVMDMTILRNLWTKNLFFRIAFPVPRAINAQRTSRVGRVDTHPCDTHCRRVLHESWVVVTSTDTTTMPFRNTIWHVKYMNNYGRVYRSWTFITSYNKPYNQINHVSWIDQRQISVLFILPHFQDFRKHSSRPRNRSDDPNDNRWIVTNVARRVDHIVPQCNRKCLPWDSHWLVTIAKRVNDHFSPRWTKFL